MHCIRKNAVCKGNLRIFFNEINDLLRCSPNFRRIFLKKMNDLRQVVKVASAHFDGYLWLKKIPNLRRTQIGMRAVDPAQ